MPDPSGLVVSSPTSARQVEVLLRPAHGRRVSLFQSWIWPILGWILLPWTTLMYMTVAGGGLVGFDWIILGLGVFADMATCFGGYRERARVPYGGMLPRL